MPGDTPIFCIKGCKILPGYSLSQSQYLPFIGAKKQEQLTICGVITKQGFVNLQLTKYLQLGSLKWEGEMKRCNFTWFGMIYYIIDMRWPAEVSIKRAWRTLEIYLPSVVQSSKIFSVCLTTIYLHINYIVPNLFLNCICTYPLSLSKLS